MFWFHEVLLPDQFEGRMTLQRATSIRVQNLNFARESCEKWKVSPLFIEELLV